MYHQGKTGKHAENRTADIKYGFSYFILGILCSLLVIIGLFFLSKSHIAGKFSVPAAVVVIFCAVLLWIQRKSRQKRSAEQEWYYLLEQFSSTVLFRYDLRRDRIDLTSNAKIAFRSCGLKQDSFFSELETKNFHKDDFPLLRTLLSGEYESDEGECWIRLMHPKEKRYIWHLIQLRYLYENGKRVFMIGEILNIDRQKRREDQLLKMSQTDALTGLHNKRFVERQIAERLAEDSCGMLFMVDVDNFKTINDIYGHAAGDRALRFIAECMRNVFRSSDRIGRFGGDEMIIYMGGLSERRIAQEKWERLTELLATCEDNDLPPISVSAGVAQYPKDGTNYEELYQAADRAMYRAKRLGKQQYCFCDACEKNH